jgi:hypothetical protein
MTWFARIASVAALASVVACGKSPEQPQVEQVQKNAQQLALRAAQELQTILPEVSGWAKSHPEAERMTSPVSFSYASTRYKKDDAEITEKVTDSGFNQMLIAPLSMMLAAGYSKESTDGFEKSTTVAGYPAFEKWDKSDQNGELTVFVNQRFVVELEGTGLADNKQLQAFLARTDLKKLAALK